MKHILIRKQNKKSGEKKLDQSIQKTRPRGFQAGGDSPSGNPTPTAPSTEINCYHYGVHDFTDAGVCSRCAVPISISELARQHRAQILTQFTANQEFFRLTPRQVKGI